jgi:aryl-alcohol dehydrogenase-like predicted oxidoreductase
VEKLEKRELGHTGLRVSRLAFGSLTMGPLQRDMTPEAGGRLLHYAYERGVNFVDTAELYGTYPHIREALKVIPREDYVISTKSYAYDRKTAEASLNQALSALDTNYLDLFMLHEQESEHTLRGHREALDYFLEQKQKGILRTVGLSTHFIAAVRAAVKTPELDVIHPIINLKGIGIQDGSAENMLQAIRDFKTRNAGGGVFAMKPLAGGHLIKDPKAAFDFVLKEASLDAIAVGMQSTDEIDANITLFTNQALPDDLKNRLSHQERYLMVHDWCSACGNCEKRCQQQAIKVQSTGHGNRAVVDHEKCVLCGYCSTVCPEFCLKVI